MARPKKDGPDREERRRELIEWRRRLGLTKVEAGKLLNYCTSNIRVWEKGERYIPDEVYQMVKEDNDEG